MTRTQWPMQWHNNVWAILSCSSCCTKVHFPQVIKKLPLNLLVSVGQGHILPLDGCVDGIWLRGKWWLHPPHFPPRPSSCRHSSPRSSLTSLSGAESDPGRQTWSEHWLSSWMLYWGPAWSGRVQLPPGQRSVWSVCRQQGSSHLKITDQCTLTYGWMGYSAKKSLTFPLRALSFPFSGG